MDKYTIAPPAGSTNNSVGAADRPWKAGHFDSVKLNGGDLGSYLAESTGYGIVSGCTPTISGLTVSVASGVVHLADGTRKEISASTVTLDSADTTNPRVDLVYITSAGVVAKVTGTAAASPSAPSVTSGGISVAQVSVAANGTTGTLTDMRGMLARWYNTGIVNVKDFGAVGDGVTDDTAAIQKAVDVAIRNNKLLTAEAGVVYAVSSPINIKGLLFSDWNNATIKAIDTVTSVVNLDDNYRQQPWYGSIEKLQIDCNSMSDCGLLITHGEKKTIRDITVTNVNKVGIKHQSGYEVFGTNWHITGNGVSTDSVGFIPTGDSYYNNIIIIDCYTAVSGSTYTSRVENLHAWILTPSLYEGSTFWFIPYDGTVYGSHFYSDTYEYNLRFKGTAAHTYINDLEVLYNSEIVPASKISDTVYFCYFNDTNGVLYTRDIILNNVTYSETMANKKFTNADGFCGEVYQFHRKNIYVPLVTLPPTVYNPNADNLVINSNFTIAQRASSQSAVGMGSFDRWKIDGSVTSVAMSKSTCDLLQAQYENKIVLDISGSGNWCELQQVVENGIANIVNMPVTVSFWVKASTAVNMAVKLRQTGSAVAEIGSQSESVSASKWTFVEKTFYFNDASFTPAQPHLLLAISMFTSATYEIANVKLEVNKKHSDYKAPVYADEIAECQRYYQKLTLKYYGDFAQGDSYQNGALMPKLAFSKMRTTPSVTIGASSEQLGAVLASQASQGVGWLFSDGVVDVTNVNDSSLTPRIKSNTYTFTDSGYKILMNGTRTIALSADF